MVAQQFPRRADPLVLQAIVTNPQNRIKADEVRWSGLLAWADSQPAGPIEKRQSNGLLQEQAEVQFEEQTPAPGMAIIRSQPNAFFQISAP